MSKKIQTMRYTDTELDVIKSSFADNLDLLKALRKHFLQLPMNAIEEALLQAIKTQSGSLAVLRKTFLPTIDGDAPIHQVMDLWNTIDFKDKTPEESYVLFLARKKTIEYLDQQLNLLESKKQKIAIFFDELASLDKKAQEAYMDFTVRNNIIAHIEFNLNQLNVLAGLKDETVEQTQERLLKDSTK